METFNPSDVFGSMVFNDHVMRERLPHATYKEFKKTLAENRPLSPRDRQHHGQRHEGLGD